MNTDAALTASAGIPSILKARGKMRSWTCEGCGEPMLGGPPESSFCGPCEPLRRAMALRQIPREEIFRGTGTPDEYRTEPPWAPDDWPRDHRPRASKIHPASEWPGMAAELTRGGGEGPRSVVLAGPNDTGKSHRAGDLVVRLHREGLIGATWASEFDLLEEKGLPRHAWERDETPWPLWAAAKASPVLVVDDLLSHRGGPASIETSCDRLLALVEARWASKSRVTIYTTHRTLSRNAAVKAGQPESASVQAIVPAVYGRLKDGLILSLEGEGHRGKWAR